MTINASNGHIELPELGFEISPELLRAAFEALPVFDKAGINVRNEPWCSWRLPPIPLGEAWLFATLFFNGEKLHFVSMAIGDEGGIDPPREHERHMHFLRDVWQAPPGDYDWGTVWAAVDPRTRDDYESFSVYYVKEPLSTSQRLDAKLRVPNASGFAVAFVLGASFFIAGLAAVGAWLWVNMHPLK